MDRAEMTVRNMLDAVEAPLYDIGVLSERGMLPGLDNIPAAAVLERLPLLKYRNAHGSHIYIRPSGENRFTVLDDLNETTLGRLVSDGFNPCGVVETSAGNFQAWLKHPAVLPKPIGTFAAQTLANRYDADPSAADWRRFGRLPGFTNCKPKHRKLDGSAQESQRRTVSGGRGIHRRDHQTLPRARTAAGGAAHTGFSFSPTGTEVIESVSGAIPHLRQVPGPTCRRGHSVLCRRLCQWHDGGPYRTRP